ncbi:MAG: LegC family aminotransferase [Bacteroidota bacterium]
MEQLYTETVNYIKELYPNKSFIPLHEPKFNGNEKAYLINTIDSTFVSSVGAYVDQFEAMMREYTGAKYAIAVVNGTAALHIALQLAGVKKGDLVITQALSFVATCNAISYLNAEPCFVDVSAKTLGMCPDALKSFLKDVEVVNNTPIHKPTGKRIGACVPMHTFGFPAEIDTLVNLCNQYHIPLVEDAAESIGSTYKGKQTGTFGLLGTYSFNGNKTITCGGGGIIVTNDDKLGPLAKHLTTQAKVPHKWEFVHDHIGYNYRCPNLNAALACAQLEQLNAFIENKRETAKLYENFFANSPLSFITEPADTVSNYWLNAILTDSKEERDAFLTYTNSNGVMTRPVWTLMHKLTMFAHCIHDDLTNSLDIEARLVNIPSSVRG